MSSKHKETDKKPSKIGWKILVASIIIGTIIFFLFPDLKDNLVSQVSTRTSQDSNGNTEQGSPTPNIVDGYEYNDGDVTEVDGDQTETEPKVDTQYHFDDLVGAAIDDDAEKVRNILKRNPELSNATDKNGWRAIHEASRAHAHNALKVLVQEFGANVNVRTDTDGKGYTPLALATSDPNDVASKGGKEAETVSYLKSIGAVSLNRGEYSREDLVDATRKNDINTMTVIIEQHPEYVHQKDRNGWTPLHEAIRAGQAYAASHLIEFGRADVNVQTNTGATPLYMAIHHVNGADEDTVRYLVKMGGTEKGPRANGDL
jgi:ankyrin repeat protein